MWYLSDVGCSLCVQPFGPILNLVPMAESVIKLKAVCMVCFKDAAFTKRLGAEKEVGCCFLDLLCTDSLVCITLFFQTLG